MGLYQYVVPPGIKSLHNLSGILQKGVKFADEKAMKHEDLLNFRLAPDMRGLSYQIQSVCNTLKFIPARMGIMDDVFFADDETTFEQLQIRLHTTIELLEKIDEKAMDEKENQPLLMKTARMGTFKFQSSQAYVTSHALPNLHFHMTSAYCILRHLGVPLNAMDYLGADTYVKVE